jgi:hypothetical protein
MKYQETTFDEYICASENYNLHPQYESIFENIQTNNIGNTIFYGPPGSGKYTQVLNMLKYHSPSKLKYQTKMTINTEKTNYTYFISDVHYEIDMNLLGCNSKTLWYELFMQIIDIVYTKQSKQGYIVCKNFHKIHTELLDIFYSYMQEYTTKHSHIRLNYILITEELGFIPNNILHSCRIIRIPKPSKKQLLEIVNNKKLLLEINTNEINNIKMIKNMCNHNKKELKNSMIKICDEIINTIINPEILKYNDFRERIYDLLTYNIDIVYSIQYILFELIKRIEIDKTIINEILDHTYISLKYYNNNYRPIYHIENILLYITSKINKYE